MKEFYGEEAALVLQELAGQHVFIQPLGEGGTYRYYALFQQIPEAKWEPSDFNRFISLQKKAADYYSTNSLLKLIYHAIKSGDDLFITQKLADTGNALVKLGQFDWLLDTIKTIFRYLSFSIIMKEKPIGIACSMKKASTGLRGLSPIS